MPNQANLTIRPVGWNDFDDLRETYFHLYEERAAGEPIGIPLFDELPALSNEVDWFQGHFRKALEGEEIFLVAEREMIPPSGHRSTTLFPELAVPDGYQPRGSAATARASHPKLDRNHASTIDRRPRQKPATMSVLQLCHRKAVTAQKFMTQ